MTKPIEPTPDEPTQPKESVKSDSAGGLSFLDTAHSLKLQGPPDWAENLDKYLYGIDDEQLEE